MSGIREVFDNVEDQTLSSETLAQAAKISDEFKKKGEWLSVSPDGLHASIKFANKVYYDGDESDLLVAESENFVLDATKGKRGIVILRSNNVITNTGEESDRLKVHDSKNVIINSRGGNDGIGINSSKNVLVNSGEGDERIASLRSSGLTIKSGNGSDVISVDNSNNINIDGGDGNDSMRITSSDNVSINGGDGNDVIEVEYSKNVIIDDGDGNDKIMASGIISGGTGDDYIKLSRSLFLRDENIQDVIKYSKGDGHDIVEGVTDDTIIELNGISEDEYDITESRNENGAKVKTLTMKDGSGSIKMTYNGSKY